MLLTEINNNYKRSLKEYEQNHSFNCGYLIDQEITLLKNTV